MDLEIEELLLSCYISSVIKSAKKNLQKHNVKKVHFGDNSIKEYTLEEEYIEGLDDTTPINTDDPFHSLGMDEESLENSEMPYSNWLESSPVNLKVDTTVTKSKSMDTYEEFLNGARKRLFLHVLKEKDIDAKSPEKKKMRCVIDSNDDIMDRGDESMEIENTFRCSTPDTEHEEIMEKTLDVLMFLKYHVLSYAIHTHLSQLNNNQISLKTSRNAELFFNLCSRDSKSSCNATQPSLNACIQTRNNNKSYQSRGVLLATDIVKQSLNSRINDDDTYIIRNEASDGDFQDEQTCKKYIHQCTQRQPINVELELSRNEHHIDEALLPHHSCLNIHIQEDLTNYLMPETDEPTLESVYPLHSVTDLRAEQLPETILPSNTLQNEELTGSDKLPIEESFELREEPLSLFLDDFSNEITESPSITKRTDDIADNIDNTDNHGDMINMEYSSTHFNINEMISELMASQALRSDGMELQPRNQFKTFMKPVTQNNRIDISSSTVSLDWSSTTDSVVPDNCDWRTKELEISLHENLSVKEEKENQKSCVQKKESTVVECSESNDQTVPSLKDRAASEHSKEKFVRPSFQWNRAGDDCVVPFSHELFINSPQKINAPQKIRLGLSKKNKVRAVLHPYKKL